MSNESDNELRLHAYVDGNLDEQEMEQVEEYLKNHPEAVKRVWEYLKQKDDIRRYAQREASADAGPEAHRLGRTLARRLEPRLKSGGRRMLAVAIVFVAGWLLHAFYAPLVGDPPYTEEVLQAHLLSSTDPAEIPPISPQRLSRMFARIGELERLPDLRDFGYEPLGAQLLPSDEGIVLHVPYRAEDGNVLSYFLLHRDKPDEMEPHHIEQNGVHIVYWQHDQSRFALASLLPEERINQMVHHIDRPASGL